MKFKDFESLEKYNTIRLHDWVIKGEHCPEVTCYHNPKNNQGFQVSFKHKKFRKTKVPNDVYEVLSFEKWEDLED